MIEMKLERETANQILAILVQNRITRKECWEAVQNTENPWKSEYKRLMEQATLNENTFMQAMIDGGY